MGAKKKSDGENHVDNSNVVLKVDMHCDGCATKIIKYLRAFKGVETVKVEFDTGKITVTGKVDPTKLKDSLREKIKKKVELISPQPKKEKENKDTEANNKSEKKNEDNKSKDKEAAVATAVLKVALHCQGCLDRIRKTVSKTKGVHEMAIDKEKETVTVKGTMDVKALVGNLKKLRREVEVVPPKKDNEGAGGDKEGGKKKKKNKGNGDGEGGCGDDNNNENDDGGEVKMEQLRMEYMQIAPVPFGFGYGYGNIGGYNYGQVYPEQLHFHVHPQSHAIFSDENPNGCSVM